MAAASWNYLKVLMEFQTPWTKKGGIEQPWSLSFCVTQVGEVPLSVAQVYADTFWTNCVQGLCAPQTQYLGGKVYAPNNSIAYGMWSETGKNGDLSAYPQEGGPQQLEVVALYEAKVGTNSLNRPVFLRKHIHDVQGEFSPIGNLGPLSGTWVANSYSTLTGGLGDDAKICDPRTGAVPAEWVLKQALYTRQLRKGDQRAKASAG